MNSDQLVIREFLKANPDVTDTPVVLRKELFNGKLRGVLNWPRTDDALVTGTCFYQCELPDLAKLFTGISIRLAVWKPKTHRDVAKVLFETYGVVANLDDIAPTPMSYDPLPDTVTLTALPGALTIKGSLEVMIYQKVMDLSEIITVNEIDAVVDRFPLSNPLMVLEKKYYGYDFTDVRDTLKVFTNLGPVLNVQSVYDEMSGPTWGSSWDRPQPFNLYGIRLVYLGPTSGYPDANPAYTNCAVYSPGYMSSSTASGSSMILHFNL